jgi:hypothetical protein
LPSHALRILRKWSQTRSHVPNAADIRADRFRVA